MKILIAILTISLVSACTDTEVVEVVVTKEEKAAMRKDSILKARKWMEARYDTIRLDGCQYYIRATGLLGLKGKYMSYKGQLSHKGNCDNPIHKCKCP